MAPEGARNNKLYRSAFTLGRFVASGDVGARELGETLVDAAIGRGLARPEAERTVASAFSAALKGPR